MCVRCASPGARVRSDEWSFLPCSNQNGQSPHRSITVRKWGVENMWNLTRTARTHDAIPQDLALRGTQRDVVHHRAAIRHVAGSGCVTAGDHRPAFALAHGLLCMCEAESERSRVIGSRRGGEQTPRTRGRARGSRGGGAGAPGSAAKARCGAVQRGSHGQRELGRADVSADVLRLRQR